MRNFNVPRTIRRTVPALSVLALAACSAEERETPEIGDTVAVSHTVIADDMAGEMVCLPHRDTEGPHTLECAYGLLLQSGAYVTFVDPTKDQRFSSEVEIGDLVGVDGLLSLQPGVKYDTEGSLTVESLVFLD